MSLQIAGPLLRAKPLRHIDHILQPNFSQVLFSETTFAIVSYNRDVGKLVILLLLSLPLIVNH